MQYDQLTPLLEIFDMEQSLRFYRDVLGFEVTAMSDGKGWCRLEAGKVSLMLNTAYDPDEQRPEQPLRERVRWHRDTTLYFSCDPDKAYARLSERGWPASRPTATSYGMREVTARDPDGFSLSFIAPD